MVELDPCQAVEAVRVRHADVEQHQIGFVLDRQFEAGVAVVGLGDDADVRALQHALQSCANYLVVVHDQQRNCHAKFSRETYGNDESR